MKDSPICQGGWSQIVPEETFLSQNCSFAFDYKSTIQSFDRGQKAYKNPLHSWGVPLDESSLRALLFRHYSQQSQIRRRSSKKMISLLALQSRFRRANASWLWDDCVQRSRAWLYAARTCPRSLEYPDWQFLSFFARLLFRLQFAESRKFDLVISSAIVLTWLALAVVYLKPLAW